LALFEFFAREPQPFTVGRITKTLGMPQVSVSMLLRNLQEIGYLDYDPRTRTYAPSIRVALLGSWIDRRFEDAGAIAGRLQELQRQVGRTVYVGVQNAAAAQCVMLVCSREPDRLDVSSGVYVSLTCSAMGQALLSRLPDAEVLSWARRCNAEASLDADRVREMEFLGLIRTVRGQGFAEAEHAARRRRGLAVTFDSPIGGPALAVGVGGPAAGIAAERSCLVAALRDFTARFPRPSPVLVAPAFGRGRDAEARRLGAPAWGASANSDAPDWGGRRRGSGIG
jgi:DNA-binding IclR family transcriptional regulator